MPGILKATLLPLEKGVEKWQQHTEPEQEVGGAGYCVFLLLLLWFILLNFFLFFPLLILIDNIPSCPGLCSHQVCQVGPCPRPSQTLGFLFGSSLEPSLKGGLCCQCSPSDFFFFLNPI